MSRNLRLRSCLGEIFRVEGFGRAVSALSRVGPEAQGA